MLQCQLNASPFFHRTVSPLLLAAALDLVNHLEERCMNDYFRYTFKFTLKLFELSQSTPARRIKAKK